MFPVLLAGIELSNTGVALVAVLVALAMAMGTIGQMRGRQAAEFYKSLMKLRAEFGEGAVALGKLGFEETTAFVLELSQGDIVGAAKELKRLVNIVKDPVRLRMELAQVLSRFIENADKKDLVRFKELLDAKFNPPAPTAATAA